MSGTSLYRALIEAGASEETARDAAGEIDDMKTILVEVRTTNRILIALVLATFLLILRISFS